jgi:hypothetical protein
MYYETTFEDGYMSMDAWELWSSFGFIKDEEDGTGITATITEIAGFMEWTQIHAYRVVMNMTKAKYVTFEPTGPREALVTLT